MSNQQHGVEGLPFMPSQERLSIYQIIVDGCHHIFSKNKLQVDRAQSALEALVPLTKNDPFFLAHLTSYAMTKLKAKDLQVFTAYVSALSSADGMPFSPGSKYKKPNLRYIAAAAVHMMDPKLALRVGKLMNRKFEVPGYLRLGRHYPTFLESAFQKYLRYRELNLDIVRGIKKAGLAEVYENLYRTFHLQPSDEVAAILKWNQRGKTIAFEESINFSGLEDLAIAQKIQNERLPVLGVISALGHAKKKISPVIAVAMLEQATGNQAVILRKTFEDSGVLTDPEVMKLYETKIRTAKTALDRAETLSKTASEEVKKALSSARAESRQAETVGLGKIYIHLDDSGSMSHIREFAIEKGSIFAECVNNPKDNFAWGMFGSRGQELPLPQEFVKEAFAQVLFSYRDGGSTWGFALYPAARRFGADIDIFVSDQYVDGYMDRQIEQFHRSNPNIKKPKACVVVDFGGERVGGIQSAYESNGIPVTVIKPEKLTESALVIQAVKTALQGPVAIIDEIMETPLLTLPDYYYTLD